MRLFFCPIFTSMLRRFHKRQSKYDDDELLLRYQSSGDTQWLGQLFRRYLELVYGVCLKYLKDSQRAEDASMEVFEALVEKAQQHDIQNFKSWLYVLTKNHCLMQLRRDSRMPSTDLSPNVMQSIAEPHPIIERLEEEGDYSQHLNECLSTLSEHQVACIRAFYLEGHSYKEVADFRQEPLGRVRSHIQNGRRNLRNCIEKRAGIRQD